MANPPPLITDDLLQQMIDDSIQRAISQHELRFSLYGMPLIIGVVVGMLWLR